MKKHEQRYYTTLGGKSLPIQPISLDDLKMSEAAIRKEFIGRGEKLDPPEYEIEVFGGEKEKHPHDETTLKTDEDRAAWAEHRKAVNDFLYAQSELVLNIILEDGLPESIVPTEAWLARMKRRKIDIPEDESERRKKYILSEYLRTPMDVKAFIAEIMVLSAEGLDNQAEVEAAMSLFLSPV